MVRWLPKFLFVEKHKLQLGNTIYSLQVETVELWEGI